MTVFTPFFTGLFTALSGLLLAPANPALAPQKQVALSGFGPSAEPLLVYQRMGSWKPYVQVLKTPSGWNVLRDAPEDHHHHHALMFAVGVDGIDFWAEEEGSGRQVESSLSPMQPATVGDAKVQGFRQKIDWKGPGRESALLTEQRTIQLIPIAGKSVTLVNWETNLSPGSGEEAVELWGRHYFGLGLRFVESMDSDGNHFRAGGEQGELVRGDEYVTPARWAAYSAGVEGHPVTVAVFDHPQNPRHPAGIFYMSTPFAYLAPGLQLWKEPLPLGNENPLKLRYGVAAWDGAMTSDQVEEIYQAWVHFHTARSSR